jgi:DNA-binding MarR family transcriptional regulator
MGAHTSDPAVRASLDSFRRIVRALRQFDREAEKRAGLSGAQVFVLQKLAEAGGTSINELAARTHTHQSSVSVVAQKLVDRKLVRRMRSPRDARKVELALTDQGKALLRKAPPAAQDRLIAALKSLAAPRRRLLNRLLADLIQKMRIEREPPTLFFEDHSPRRRRGGSNP